MNKRNKQSGYSLTEIMLGLGVATAISGGIWGAFGSATTQADGYKNQVEMIQKASEFQVSPTDCYLNADGTLPEHCWPKQPQ
jgi:hypothetical protein